LDPLRDAGPLGPHDSPLSSGADPSGTPPVMPLWPPRRKFQSRLWLHGVLLLATIGSTWLVGGWTYAVTVIAILGAHELGHYFTCRYYGVDASLPYFLPNPLPPPIGLFGTLGAVIRIREPIPSKPILFDIGFAGPIAGFLVLVPALFIGIASSEVVPIGDTQVWFGEPLLIKAAAYVFWGPLPADQTLAMNAMAFAAWFGMLATALNLFPIGQLDGGHIAYAVFGRRSTYVTLVMTVVAASLCFVSPSWIVWTALMVVMLIVVGPRHPRTYDEDVPLDPRRRFLAAFAVFMFAVCFTPVPIELLVN
jgi:membrane-associated protease RseP (regulator of RpoE activity)